MIVEPMAGDSLEQNLNPVGRLYDAGSTMICLPTSLSQEVGAGLGAQASPEGVSRSFDKLLEKNVPTRLAANGSC